MRITAAVYNGFLWALAIAITAFGNVWLEMRVNMGWVLCGCWLALTLLLWLSGGQPRRRPGCRFSALNTIISSAYAMALLGVKRLAVVPAAIIREGLGLPRIPFATVNATLIAALLLGLLALFIAERRGSDRGYR